MPLYNMKNQCTAHSKKTGERCQNPAVTGYTVCMHHGANPKNRGGRPKGCTKPAGSGGPPPKGNTNALKHGAYSPRLLPEHQEHFDRVKAALEEELGGSGKLSVADHLLIFQVAATAAKIFVATEKDVQADAVIPLQRLLMELLRELKSTRASKDGGSSTGNTPAEVICNLLERVARAKAAGALPGPRDQGPVIDAELVDVGADSQQEED